MATRHAYAQFDVSAHTGTPPQIVHVTNNNASGAGSFHEAWAESVGPRIIVFDVGGRFPVTSNFYLESGDVWIAGQTAPSQVLIDQTVTGKSLRIRDGNVFMQHCILWHSALPEFPGQDNGNNDNALIVSSPSGVKSNIVLDHCFIGGGTDQVALFYIDVDNITLVDTLVGCPRGKDPEEASGPNFHQYNMSLAGNSNDENADYVSLIGCVFEDGTERNPGTVVEHASYVNHLVYNRGTTGLMIRGKSDQDLAMSFSINVVGVWDRRGPNYVGSAQSAAVGLGRSDGTQDFYAGAKIFVDDCVATRMDETDVAVADEWDMVSDANDQETAVRSDTLVADGWPEGLVAAPMRSLSVADRLTLMTQNVGPRPNERIQYIQDIVDDIVNGTGAQQTDYPTPAVASASSAYVEPSTPHAEGIEAGRSVVEEDLLDRGEALLR
jgi:hypothetical protein